MRRASCAAVRWSFRPVQPRARASEKDRDGNAGARRYRRLDRPQRPRTSTRTAGRGRRQHRLITSGYAVKLAALDVGTNTVLMLVVEQTADGRLLTLADLSRITR